MRSTKTLATTTFAALVMGAAGSSAMAQHAGDIHFDYEHNEVHVHFDDFTVPGPFPVHAEHSFPTAGFGARQSSNPGFETEHDENITPNHIIGYNILDVLHYHDGSNFASAGATFLNIQNRFTGPGLSDVVASGLLVTGGGAGGKIGSGYIGQADSEGDFHAHVNYTLSSDAAFGVYGVWMSLSSYDDNGLPSGVGDSEPFWVLWNYGLTTEQFAAAAQDFSTIPEPAALSLLAVGALALVRRQRRC